MKRTVLWFIDVPGVLFVAVGSTMLSPIPAVLATIPSELSISAVSVIGLLRLGCGGGGGGSAGRCGSGSGGGRCGSGSGGGCGSGAAAVNGFTLNGPTLRFIGGSAIDRTVGGTVKPQEEALSTIEDDFHIGAIRILRAIEVQASIVCQDNLGILACTNDTSRSGVAFHGNLGILFKAEVGRITDSVPKAINYVLAACAACTTNKGEGAV